MHCQIVLECFVEFEIQTFLYENKNLYIYMRKEKIKTRKNLCLNGLNFNGGALHSTFFCIEKI